jgi:hypothetical protein
VVERAPIPKTRPPDAFAEEIQRRANRICGMILYGDLEWVDVAIQIEQLRDFCRENSPDKLEAFEHIYEARFIRLWRQWKENSESGRYEGAF